MSKSEESSGCTSRAMVAVGAHSDERVVQKEIERIAHSVSRLACHELVLFVDGSKRYKVLRHPSNGQVIEFPFAKMLKNGTNAFRAFVSHQLLMAAVPDYANKNSKKFDYVWVIEEDARYAGGNWSELFQFFMKSKADLVAYSRKTNRGLAALMAVARVSIPLFRSISNNLYNLAAVEAKLPEAKPTSLRKNIHGAFIFNLCKRSHWCKYQRIDAEWLAIFRAKCPWSARIFAERSLTWPTHPDHGHIYHPVKPHPVTHGRDFKRFHCKQQFTKEGVPKHFLSSSSSASATSRKKNKSNQLNASSQIQNKTFSRGDRKKPQSPLSNKNVQASTTSIDSVDKNQIQKEDQQQPLLEANTLEQMKYRRLSSFPIATMQRQDSTPAHISSLLLDRTPTAIVTSSNK